jgi:hypothetical protein
LGRLTIFKHFEKLGDGYIKIAVATIDARTSIKAVSFGLPKSRPGAEEVVMRALKDLKVKEATFGR